MGCTWFPEPFKKVFPWNSELRQLMDERLESLYWLVLKQRALMKFKVHYLGLLLTIFLISCSNTKKEANGKISELDNEGASQEKKNTTAISDSASIIKKLQGKWKESEYPFRMANFKNTTVKFIEEGTNTEPIFREFKISKSCPFDVNNLKNAQSEDIFLVMMEAKSCEILKVSNTTLTLSGFNVSNGHDYKIVYSKME